MSMDVVNKIMVHNPNLYGMWMYEYKNENAWTTKEKRENLTSRSFQGPTN